MCWSVIVRMLNVFRAMLNGMNHDKCEGQVKETGFSVLKKKKKKQNLIKSACMHGNGQPVMHAQL